MPGTASVRDLALVGRNSMTAILLESAGFRTLADIWAANVEDDAVIQRLLQAADVLCLQQEFASVHWNNILVRAFNRLILIHDVERIETDVPDDFRCSISYRWPDDPVLTPTGHLYDRVWIERWIRAVGTDPMTRMHLALTDLVPVTDEFRSRMQDYRMRYALGDIPMRMVGNATV